MTLRSIADYRMPMAEDFPANATEWRLDPDRAVMLIHDVQRYFLDFYAPDSELIAQMVANLARLRTWARRQGIPVVYTAQPHLQSSGDRALLNDIWGPGLTAGDADSARIDPRLAPGPEDIVLAKWRYSAFKRSDLAQRMRHWQGDQLVIGGVYAHIGCMATALDAFMEDIQPFVVADAMADFSREDHLLALRYVATRCGHVLDTIRAVTSVGERLGRHWLESWTLRALEEASAIDPDENLILHGLDSLRIMQLSSELQGRGVEVSFEELGRDPTLSRWWSLIKSRLPAE